MKAAAHSRFIDFQADLDSFFSISRRRAHAPKALQACRSLPQQKHSSVDSPSIRKTVRRLFSRPRPNIGMNALLNPSSGSCGVSLTRLVFRVFNQFYFYFSSVTALCSHCPGW
jgi:anti-sigma factor RsiW